MLSSSSVTELTHNDGSFLSGKSSNCHLPDFFFWKFFLLENIGCERCIWMFHLYRNKTIYLSHIVMNSLMTLKVNTIPRTGAGLVLLSCIYTWEISNHHQIYGLQLNIYINSIGPYFVYLQSVTQPVITKTGAPTYK